MGDLGREDLGWEDTLEKEMATGSSPLAWKIPQTEETGGLQITESDTNKQLNHHHHHHHHSIMKRADFLLLQGSGER